LAPRRVPASRLAEAAARAPVVSLRRSSAPGRHAPDTGALDPFIAAYRDELDEQLRRQQRPPGPPRRARPLARAVVVGLAAAALLTLVYGLWHALGAVRSPRDVAWQAERTSQAPTRSTPGLEGRGNPRATVEREEPRAAVERVDAAEVAGAAEPDDVEEAAPPEAGAPNETDDEASTQTSGERLAVDARLRQLDERARQAWREGKLRTAERLFLELIAEGGRHRRVELAFGDLFTLSRQLRGEHSVPRLWREYLARFPRGQYAEDARVGLCRRARGEAQRRCFQRYLHRHPDGLYAAEARALVAAGADGP
ncbi:MAG: hypothetical protein KC636_33170, partial [Myxococcales bacterium]|nr:hypothetical protein [Myxococcales bacterium]